MLPEVRREQIYAYIRNNGNATSEELSRLFNVTEETIRKDLNQLSEKGLVIRTFGGAMIKEEYDPSLDQRTVDNFEEKKAIAKAAALLIEDRDSLILDAGSTTIQLAKEIRENSQAVVVTNSLEILNVLAKIQGIKVICLGGTLRSNSMSFQGQLAESSIKNYNIHKAFISAKGVGIEEGVMDSNEPEARVKKRMIEAAREVILLVDHTKFLKLAHETVCPIDKITRIITDSKVDPQIVQEYQERGIEMMVVPL